MNSPFHSRGAFYHWKTVGKKYRNFTDLGDYVIDVDRHTRFDLDRAIEYSAKRFDVYRKFGCTALATRAENGDVLIGRNLDLTVSQLPCYVTHVKAGRYDTLNFTYDEMSREAIRYRDLLAQGQIGEELYNALPLHASDSMNEAGLYVEYNMRAYEPQFACTGTHPGAKRRVCSVCIPYLLTSHCATVEEALRYMREELDIYTLADETVASGWNLCMTVGDATGAYGLIEIANDEIRYLPRQHGQGNYYVFPAYNCISRGQSGYGRLQFGLERIDKVQTEEQMAQLMEQIMWRNEILNIPYACRDEAGHIRFYADAKHTVPSIDWRSDCEYLLPVDRDGDFVDIDAGTPEAFAVRDYKACYDAFRAGDRSGYNKEGYDKYTEYLGRCDLVWVHIDAHFEDLQRGLMRRYAEDGTFEKMARYYAGDEKPLRDDANIKTTALSLSVNCTKKRLRVKFWEKPETVMEYRF